MKAFAINRFVEDFVWDSRRLAERNDIQVSVHVEGKIRFRPTVEFVGDFGKDRCDGVGLYWSSGARAEAIADYSLPKYYAANLYILALVAAYLHAKGTARLQLLPQLDDILHSVEIQTLGPGSDIAKTLGVTASTLWQWHTGEQGPNESELYRWLQALGLVCPPSNALVSLLDLSPELLRSLREDPQRLRLLNAEQFERFVAERIDRMGYNVTLTGSTNRKDGGIDLIAVPKAAGVGSVVLAGQVKHHGGNQKTGRDTVDRLLSWKDTHFSVGLLVTNTSFTRDAIFAAQQRGNSRFLRLRDFTDLKRWVQDQYGSEDDWREIPDEVELAPGIVVKIPKPRIVLPINPQ